MNKEMKVDEALLKAAWASTFGAIAAREIGRAGIGRMEAVQRARDGADEAVRLLRGLENKIIADEQDAFKDGDCLTTQYGMLFEVELVFRDLPADPTRVTSMLLKVRSSHARDRGRLEGQSALARGVGAVRVSADGSQPEGVRR